MISSPSANRLALTRERLRQGVLTQSQPAFSDIAALEHRLVARATDTAVEMMRHPGALLLGTVVLGGAILVLKPWRWGIKPAAVLALLPALATKASVTSIKDPWWLPLLISAIEATSVRR
jgi:hypothetical protein